MAGVANRRSVFEQSPLRNRWPRAVSPFSHGAAGAVMGKIAKQYWLSADNDELIEKEKRLGFKRSVALGNLVVESWSILTAAVLLTEDQQPRKSSDRQIDKLIDWLETQIIDETPFRSINKVFSFRGHKTKARGDFVNSNSLELAFPVKAFFEFAMSELFPNEKQGQDLPCFGIFHDLAKETEGQDVIEPIEPEFAVALAQLGCEHPLLVAESAPQKDASLWKQLPTSQDQTEQPSGELAEQVILEGLSVADVLKLFDKNHPRYRSELRAAVELWASFEAKPLPDGFSPMQEIRIRLADWEVENNCELKESERTRVRVMANWDKNGNKQEPKKR